LVEVYHHKLPPAVTITPIATTPLAAKETQELKTKKNLPLSTLSDRE
jgi:hypothetical protein